VIQNHPYGVSFFIASYTDRHDITLQPVEFADFTSLKIGGTSGTMAWSSTPTPIIDNQWYRWAGTYTPSPSDVGAPFLFTAFLNLKSLHTLAIDGPMAAPEPGTAALTMFAVLSWLVWRISVRSSPAIFG
jgi:hypothetical protein